MKTTAKAFHHNFLFLVLAIFSLAACGESYTGHKPLTMPTAPPPDPVEKPSLVFADVQPIFQEFCSACHPAYAPGNWQNYENVRARVETRTMQKRLLELKNMPPVGTPQSMDITQADRDLVEQWINDGANP